TTLPDSRGVVLAMYASARLRMKNTVASTAVARDRKFADPVAPNRLEEAPPPKPEPMSAPLPCWSSTRPMMASATSTWVTMMMLVQIPIARFRFLSLCGRAAAFLRRRRGAQDRDEVLRHQRCAADQPAVDVRHGEDRRGVVGLDAAAVE